MPAVSTRRKGVEPLSHRLRESSNSRVTDHHCGPQNAVTRRGNLRLPASGTHGITTEVSPRAHHQGRQLE